MRGEEMVRAMTEAIVAIIDDDDQARSGIESLLRSLDYAVRAFASAEAFLQSPQLRHIACIISDVRMSGLSGIELQERLNAEGCRIPMILVTAHPDAHVRERAMRAGAAAFLRKPVSKGDLIPCLDGVLKNA